MFFIAAVNPDQKSSESGFQTTKILLLLVDSSLFPENRAPEDYLRPCLPAAIFLFFIPASASTSTSTRRN
jgi:hypothetical protein